MNADPTSVIVATATVLLLAWEAVSLYRSDDAIITISQAVTQAARRRPIIVFFFGLLMGHWFWSYWPPCP